MAARYCQHGKEYYASHHFTLAPENGAAPRAAQGIVGRFTPSLTMGAYARVIDRGKRKRSARTDN